MSRNWKLTAREGDSEVTTLITQAAATRTNICLQSEDFGTTWAQDNGASTFNQTAAPDGTLTADKLLDDSATGTGNVRFNQNLTVATSTTYTYSIYAKADQLNWTALQVSSMASQAIVAYYDLANGAVGATTGAQNVAEGIEDVGDGWYRCWLSFTTDATDTTLTLRVYAANGNGDATVALDGTSSVFVWGAQVEVATSPTAYIKTLAAAETAPTRLQDDIHIALETVLEVTNQSTDDLWQRYKRLT